MLQLESALPLYVQVKETLVRQIRSGKYQPHSVLPAERELMEQFGVSRITVRRALSDLANEGLVYRKVGRGTYVAAEPIVENLTELVGHLEELQRRDLHPEVSLIEQGFRAPSPDVAQALGSPPGVYFARRLISVDGTPLLILDLCLPGDLGFALDVHQLTEVPIHTALERQGLTPHAAEQRVTARSLHLWEAEMLGTTLGAPALEVVRTEWDAAGRGMLWTRALYRGDRYQYTIRLHRRRPRG
ncbi:MAG TPA: GntR family transcriptional regulator [Symbiobacteriaceae bacterium]|nr:GntR family transcriptional regulator [Symbiobacteriaceae bacterium]